MFQFGTAVRGYGRIKRAALAALAAAGALGCVTAATPASAAEIFLRSDSLSNPGTAYINGPSVNVYAYSGPVLFKANDGVGLQGGGYDILGFCVDIFHDITAGVNSQQALNLQYHTAALTSNGGGGALSAGQIQQLSGLITYGSRLYRTGGVDLSNKLAGVQGAIWQVENPTYTVTGGNSAIQSYINQYVALAPTLHGSSYAIYADNFATQGFGVAAVPEPGVWLLMMVGVAGLGLKLRAHRRAKTAGAAVLA